ncbi:O-acetylserine/cysteine exporter [Youhaiella tibetensis]|uniref:EamA family transporter n=1 Tax=Paradevosia tibetensis TaxID=1447062 RepID=A0A5B9DTQ9_9HYPH|nr:EamA family transporter [Youhaiella tibetensis]QEE22452.1 EamA family transporter [Youhaiella tibetensis]GGF42150.1 O-acetylserine/cysteine exporter [Youhaiella tibetensis]
MSARDILLALFVVVIWGLNFVAIKWGVEEMPPLLLTALRYLAAAFPAVLLVKPPKVALPVLLVYGLAVGVLQFGLLFSAVHLGMPAGLSSLVMQVQAFFTIALAVLFLGERPGVPQLAGAVIAFAGIGVIALERLEGAALVPLLMTVGAAFFWGVSNIATKKAGKVDMFAFVVWGSLVPPLPLLALSLLLEGPDAMMAGLTHMSLRTVGSIAFLGYCATLMGYGLWSYLLGRYPASVVAPFSLLVPIVGMASAVAILGEPLSLIEVLGSGLVFAGLLLNVFGPRMLRRLAPAQ